MSADALHCIHRTDAPPSTTNKAAHIPAHLRSYKLPQPKITAAPRIAQVLGELGVTYTRLVMPTRDNCARLESLIETAGALVETKKVVDKVEQDIKTMKSRLAALRGEGGGEGGGEGDGHGDGIGEDVEDAEMGGEAEPGDSPETPMDVDEVGDADADGDGDERAPSVVSTRSTRSRKQVRGLTR